ncbi:DUF805 domain-containing protein [uncultured Erythrobacter sp.]|uniref:DUF805 domain-containing protein n=1 Tax=uncultured Erythrobacter sp. TaxID=263913 RepID=UPI00262A3D9A|nr:DUF805 domain-containing protein [uncultured Erythrobacter sp.]
MWLFETVELRNLFRLSGRSTRREFLTFLVIGLAMAVFGIADLDGPFGLPITLMALTLVVAAAVRRINDHGGTKWVLLAIFVPYLGIGIVTYFLFIPGDPFANNSGANPRERNQS